MNTPQSQPAPLERTEIALDPSAVALKRITRRSVLDPDHPLRCVSSGYLKNGHSCENTVPLGVVHAAWNRESERAGVRRNGFFHFSWQNRVWLAYGLSDGRVRGVYCADHAAERDRRSFADHA